MLLHTENLQIDKKKKHNVEIIVDRLVIKEDIKSRLTESIEIALKHANNIVIIKNIIKHYMILMYKREI